MPEKNYKASVGVTEFWYGVLDPASGSIITGAPTRVKFLQNITVEMPQEAVRAYGDNKTAEIAVSSGNTTVTSAFHKIPKEDKEILFGLESVDGLTAYGSTDTPPYVAVIFCKTHNDGSKEWVGLVQGMFMRPNISGQTKEDGVEFANEEVTAEFMEREVDGFTDEKTALFGEDDKGTTATRDALFQAVFGQPFPTTTTTTTTSA
ncbi:major tail protein [Halobacillus sp. BBL2006]|uniref:major tail protein n=1 Tax=Halobacillus sp. BBL2006 TaxID=1543706 RepID=UPI000542F2DB|nr:major tail protein [Halobacillus sp. BBL2006]KHE73154.1 hypothetical protein LD39_00760 [Halobacillus sp. BBL2006]